MHHDMFAFFSQKVYANEKILARFNVLLKVVMNQLFIGSHH